MQIKSFSSKYLGANCFLLIENGHAIVIDPCESKALEDALDGVKLDCVLLTHEHADHISGVNRIREKYSAPIVCSEKCAVNMLDTKMNYSKYFDSIKSLMGYLQTDMDVHMEPFTCQADITFSADCIGEWQGHSIFAKLTPGHSNGGVSYMFDEKVLFVGDNVFCGMETITRFKGGSQREFEEKTLPWLQTLNAETQIYPGHFEPLLLKCWHGFTPKA